MVFGGSLREREQKKQRERNRNANILNSLREGKPPPARLEGPQAGYLFLGERRGRGGPRRARGGTCEKEMK